MNSGMTSHIGMTCTIADSKRFHAYTTTISRMTAMIRRIGGA